mmetsp:Transcript_14397/g.38165  ORF Transcript_14397/g.38165 Transcript_14397/m.38165 type:complete len:266 (-) Transcript_14397:130-927(-)
MSAFSDSSIARTTSPVFPMLLCTSAIAPYTRPICRPSSVSGCLSASSMRSLRRASASWNVASAACCQTCLAIASFFSSFAAAESATPALTSVTPSFPRLESCPATSSFCLYVSSAERSVSMARSHFCSAASQLAMVSSHAARLSRYSSSSLSPQSFLASTAHSRASDFACGIFKYVSANSRLASISSSTSPSSSANAMARSNPSRAAWNADFAYDAHAACNVASSKVRPEGEVPNAKPEVPKEKAEVVPKRPADADEGPGSSNKP